MKKLNIIGINCKSNDDELKQMLSDMIEMYIEDKNKMKEQHYRDLYKDKFGEDYKPVKEFVPEPSLSRIYEKEDFKRYQDYINYSKELFKLKFNTYRNLVKDFTYPSIMSDQLIDFHNKLGIETVFKPPHGTEEAWVPIGKTDIIYYDPRYLTKPIWKEVIIHELGHILDNKLGNPSNFNKLFLHNRKSSNYDLNPSEIFAESFMNYFVVPKYLKAGWPEVYDYFNKKIPGKWKAYIKELINMRSSK
jgi:hypothetical protein